MNQLSKGYGMNFANPGNQVANTPSYSTNQNRLQIDLNNPYDPLFGLIQIPAGTNLTVFAGQKVTETLKVIHHGLGYIPQVFMTFFQYTPGTTPNYLNGNYSLEEVFINAIDTVQYIPDSQNITIEHVVDLSGLFPPPSYTSTAGNIYLQVKYLICNNARIHTPNFQ